jgi:hypothetical protein
MSFLIYGRMTCPKTGTKHLQGYVEFKTCKRSAWFEKHAYYSTCQIEMLNRALPQKSQSTARRKASSSSMVSSHLMERFM